MLTCLVPPADHAEVSQAVRPHRPSQRGARANACSPMSSPVAPAQSLPSRQRIRAHVSRGDLPESVGRIVEQFFDSYDGALRGAGMDPAVYDHLLCGFVDRVVHQILHPFTFALYHRRIVEPFDYYTFGVEFLRPLVDKARSTVSGLAHLNRITAQIAAGENVVLLANHQTEGDPQAISLLLEDTHPDLGRDMIFVAGARVTTDPLPVPFSMGRNLLCIYSKRYIDHPPEDRTRKTHHNRKTMERMAELLDEGGKCIYVAPSGGRDRRNGRGIVEVAPFDPQSVEMFHLMAERASRRTHFYPMALATYEFLPPPESVQLELGESRRARRTGLHLAVGAELDMDALGSDLTDKHARRAARAAFIWQQVAEAHDRFPRDAR